MKTSQKNIITSWGAAAILLAAPAVALGQNAAGGASEFSLEATAERPRSAMERLQDLQAQHQQAFASLTALLNRLPMEPDVLGTKALFNEIDSSDREMKRIRAACSSLMASIRSELKSITGGSTFSEEQKSELTESAESMSQQCGELAAKLDLAIERLGAAYAILPKWNRIYKSYRNLQGHEQAAKQVKIQVDEYLGSFTPEPATDNTAETEETESTGHR